MPGSHAAEQRKPGRQIHPTMKPLNMKAMPPTSAAPRPSLKTRRNQYISDPAVKKHSAAPQPRARWVDMIPRSHASG